MSNKEKLKEIALELFSTRGYNAVGVQDIVDSVGITKPTLYYYFGNKQGLLAEVIKKDFDVLLENLQFATDYKGDFVKSIRNTISSYFQFSTQHSIFFRLYLTLSYSPQESEAYLVIRPYNLRLKETITKLFVSAVPSNGNLKGHEEMLSNAFIGLLNHYALGLINKELEFNEHFIYQVSQHFMHGVYAL
jgi:TetR/AcrR family transcriptional regulator